MRKNRMIAEFMGGVYLRREDPFDKRIIEEIKYDKGNNPQIPNAEFSTTENLVHLRYHCDWSWLMPVVEKICIDRIGGFRTFGMKNDDGEFMVRLNGYQLFESNTLIKATYLAVVNFIESHDNPELLTNNK